MTEDQFKLGFATLINAFIFSAAKVGEQSRDIYWQTLNTIPGDLWEKGVQQCLRNCSFFPTIKELGEACLHGHLWLTYKYNPHAYTEPKKLDWPDALAKVLKERSRPPESIEVIEEAEILPPPPTKNESRKILADLHVELKEVAPAAAAYVQIDDDGKRLREERQREERAHGQKLKIQDQLKFLESQEKSNNGNGKREDDDPKK